MNEFDNCSFFLYHCLSSSEKGLNRDLNPDLYDAGTVPYQLSYQANWKEVIMWVDYKPVDAEIDDACCCLSSDIKKKKPIKFIHSYLQFKYMENSCIIVIYLHIYGLIIDPHNELLPVGLIAQLVEHCTGITEVRVQIPIS